MGILDLFCLCNPFVHRSSSRRSHPSLPTFSALPASYDSYVPPNSAPTPVLSPVGLPSLHSSSSGSDCSFYSARSHITPSDSLASYHTARSHISRPSFDVPDMQTLFGSNGRPGLCPFALSDSWRDQGYYCGSESSSSGKPVSNPYW